MRGIPLWLAIGFMGSCGALTRHAITQWSRQGSAGLPWGTLVANGLGCLLLGLLVVVAKQEPPWMSPLLRNAVGVGFLGALTTFSTFSLETWDRWQRGLWGVATANVLLNLAVGFLAVWAGQWIARVAIASSSSS